jgi:hypothetical protein
MQTSSSAQGRLRLADHVRGCAVDGQVILLDLARSKYIGIGGGQASALAQAIDGWPCASAAPESAEHLAAGSIDIDALAHPLFAQGLLTRDPASAARVGPIEEVTRSLNAEDAVATPQIGWRRFARVLHASTVTALQLRMRSLAAISNGVVARRRRTACADDAASSATLEEAVAAYMKLRLYVFTAHDRCLHDSLTLLRFLASEGQCPTWVIGVRTHPFGAHSWLQRGQTVLNDQHEHVRRYQPILVV